MQASVKPCCSSSNVIMEINSLVNILVLTLRSFSSPWKTIFNCFANLYQFRFVQIIVFVTFLTDLYYSHLSGVWTDIYFKTPALSSIFLSCLWTSKESLFSVHLISSLSVFLVSQLQHPLWWYVLLLTHWLHLLFVISSLNLCITSGGVLLPIRVLKLPVIIVWLFLGAPSTVPYKLS